jgi:hypothetical protein
MNIISMQCDDCYEVFGVAAGATIHQNAFGFLNSSKYCTEDAASGANCFVGIARRNDIDNSAGANGDRTAAFYALALLQIAGTGFVSGDVGRKIYGTSPTTRTFTSGSNCHVATVTEFVSSTQVWAEVAGSAWHRL